MTTYISKCCLNKRLDYQK